MTRIYTGISLDPDLLAEVDAHAGGNRSAYLAAILRRWWIILDFGAAELREVLGSDLLAALGCIRAAGIDRPESPLVAFSEEFADAIDLGARLTGVDADARARIYDAVRLLDYVGRVALVGLAEGGGNNAEAN